MLYDNSRAKLYSNCKLCAGRFWCFLRDKKHVKNEQLRLRLAGELNGERKRRTQ